MPRKVDVRNAQRVRAIEIWKTGKRTTEEIADALGVTPPSVCRWIRVFNEHGERGLVEKTRGRKPKE